MLHQCIRNHPDFRVSIQQLLRIPRLDYAHANLNTTTERIYHSPTMDGAHDLPPTAGKIDKVESNGESQHARFRSSARLSSNCAEMRDLTPNVKKSGLEPSRYTYAFTVHLAPSVAHTY